MDLYKTLYYELKCFIILLYSKKNIDSFHGKAYLEFLGFTDSIVDIVHYIEDLEKKYLSKGVSNG